MENNFDGRECDVRELRGHRDFLRCIALHGATLISSSGSISCNDCTTRLWDLTKGTCKVCMHAYTITRGHKSTHTHKHQLSSIACTMSTQGT